MRNLTFIIVLLVSSILSCTNDSQPKTPKKAPHLFAKYYVRYLQTDKELKAEVSFKEGDTLSSARPVVLTEVSFESNPMEVQNLGKTYGVRYAFRKKGPYSNSYQFNHTSAASGQHSHRVEMNPITDFSIKEGNISKTKGATLMWEGDPLQENQALVLLFTDEQNKAFSLQVKGPTKQPEYNLLPQKIAGLNLGAGKLMLVKKQLNQSQEKNISKISEMEFYSQLFPIEVIK